MGKLLIVERRVHESKLISLLDLNHNGFEKMFDVQAVNLIRLERFFYLKT